MCYLDGWQKSRKLAHFVGETEKTLAHFCWEHKIGIIPKEVIITQITNDPAFLLYLTLVLQVILTYAIILVLSLKVISSRF